MMMTRYAVLLLALLALAGCTKKDQAQGSCMAGPIDDRSIICIEYHSSKNLDEWRMACTTVMRGKWSDASCDTTQALGGCKAGGNIVWLYPSEKHRTIEDARASCSSKGREFVPAQGT